MGLQLSWCRLDCRRLIKVVLSSFCSFPVFSSMYEPPLNRRPIWRIFTRIFHIWKNALDIFSISWKIFCSFRVPFVCYECCCFCSISVVSLCTFSFLCLHFCNFFEQISNLYTLFSKISSTFCFCVWSFFFVFLSGTNLEVILKAFEVNFSMNWFKLRMLKNAKDAVVERNFTEMFCFWTDETSSWATEEASTQTKCLSKILCNCVFHHASTMRHLSPQNAQDGFQENVWYFLVYFVPVSFPDYWSWISWAFHMSFLKLSAHEFMRRDLKKKHELLSYISSSLLVKNRSSVF